MCKIALCTVEEITLNFCYLVLSSIRHLLYLASALKESKRWINIFQRGEKKIDSITLSKTSDTDAKF